MRLSIKSVHEKREIRTFKSKEAVGEGGALEELEKV